MLLAVSLLLLGTIAAALLLDGQPAPYFPIELSRLLATGVYAEWTFRLGLLVLLAAHVHEPWVLAAGACVLGVSLFDDARYFVAHMVCVYAMIALVGVRALRSPATLHVFGVAVALYAVRIGLKALALAAYEDMPVPWTVGAFVSRAQDVMLGQHAMQSAMTRLAFQAGGVIQWMVFLLLSTLI